MHIRLRMLATDDTYQRGPNATVVECPRNRFKRGRAGSSDASMTGKSPVANWSAAPIWICGSVRDAAYFNFRRW